MDFGSLVASTSVLPIRTSRYTRKSQHSPYGSNYPSTSMDFWGWIVLHLDLLGTLRMQYECTLSTHNNRMQMDFGKLTLASATDAGR